MTLSLGRVFLVARSTFIGRGLTDGFKFSHLMRKNKDPLPKQAKTKLDGAYSLPKLNGLLKLLYPKSAFVAFEEF